jgi:ADP-heptose:LPS heptosyltransferase
MRRILVIQLCRLGDLLQTTPMLRGLRRAHPHASVTLMVLDGFSQTPIPRHLYDELAVFPLDAAAGTVAGEGEEWESGVRLVSEFVAGLGEQPFDLVLNLTNSALANLLCAVIPSGELRGGLIAPDRTRVVRHPWQAYFWASLLAREFGSVNLVDLFCRVAEVPIDGEGLEIDVPANTACVGRHVSPGGPLIALQLGASDERKRWTPEQFAAMANRLPERAGTIVLVGSKGERPLGARAARVLSRPHLNAMGETSVGELAALLQRCRLLITNDTGTMHIATAVGTRVLDLSTGPVFVHETGPYAVGSLAVEPLSACFPCAAGAVCHHLSCREDFTPDDIAALAMYALEGGIVPRPARAKVLQSSRAASGRLEFRPIWDPSGGTQEQLRQAFGRLWDRSLGHVAPTGRGIGKDAELDFDVEPYHAVLRGCASRAERAAALAGSTRNAAPTEAKELSARLAEALEHEQLAATLDPVLRPIAGYLRTRLESLTDRSVDALALAYQHEWWETAERARGLAGILTRPLATFSARTASPPRQS